MERKYGGVIWTNHALQRLQQRNIKQGDAWASWNRPDTSKFDSSRGVWVYKKTWGSEEIEIVAKKNDKGEWIILSAWSSPARHGSHSHKSKKEGLFTTLFKKLFRLA